MGFEAILDLFSSNVGILWTDAALVLTILGCVLFMAKDIRLGCLILLAFLAVEFIYFDVIGADTFKVILALFVDVVILSLSLYVSYGKRQGGVY